MTDEIHDIDPGLDRLDQLLRDAILRPEDAARASAIAAQAIDDAHQRPRRSIRWTWRSAALVAAVIPALGAAAVAVAVISGMNPLAVKTPVGPAPPPSTPSPGPPSPLPSPRPPELLPGESIVISNIQMQSATTGWTLYHTETTIALLRTTDGGRTWADITPAESPRGTPTSAYFLDPDHGWMVSTHLQDGMPAQRSIVLHTEDGGRTWTASTALHYLDGNPPHIRFLDANTGWIDNPGQPAMQNSQQGFDLLRTTDGGATWQLANHTSYNVSSRPGEVPLDCGKAGAGFRDRLTGWVAGGCLGGVTFYVTHDGGGTWTRQDLRAPDGRAFDQSSCGEAGQCSLSPPVFTSSSDGTMVLTYNDGVRQRSALYVTHDGGGAWVAHPYPAIAYFDQGYPAFIDGHQGWAVAPVANATGTTSDGRVYETTNGGVSWRQVADNPHMDLGIVDFVDATHGWAMDTFAGRAPPLLYVSGDGGRTWTTLNPRVAG